MKQPVLTERAVFLREVLRIKQQRLLSSIWLALIEASRSID